MALRFASRMFAPIWSGEHVSHVEITAAETIGVEERGRFYEATGALRDMVPNHLFQLLALVAMEQPTDFSADSVRAAKAAALAALRPVAPADAARGQYGESGRLKAYRAEAHVAPDSRTETYVALRLQFAAPRWRGVDFYLRTGKHLARRKTEIVLHLKAPDTPLAGTADPTSALVLAIDPEQGIKIDFPAKHPGPALRLAEVAAAFRFGDYFEITPSVGYETLLYDAMRGDAMLFSSSAMIEAGWAALQPLLDTWKTGEPEIYPAGSAGPKSADALLARFGRKWRVLEE
jgi:glucose-6-phosphate 1-dehydrogenase